MHDLKWTPAEKTLARRLFNIALEAEVAAFMQDFKARAAALRTAEELWVLQDEAAQKRREIDDKYDYRYGRLLLLFAESLREGRLHEEQLAGLSDDKRAIVWDLITLRDEAPEDQSISPPSSKNG